MKEACPQAQEIMMIKNGLQTENGSFSDEQLLQNKWRITDKPGHWPTVDEQCFFINQNIQIML